MKVYTRKDIIWKGKIYAPVEGVAEVPNDCTYKLLKVQPPKPKKVTPKKDK